MTIGGEGELRINYGGADFINAPPGGPAYAEPYTVDPGLKVEDTAGVSPLSSESQTVVPQPSIPRVEPYSPAQIERDTIELQQDMDAMHPTPEEELPATIEQPAASLGPDNTVLQTSDGSPVTTIDGSSVRVESIPPPGMNVFGVNVPENVPHIYADEESKYLLAYGSSPEEKIRVIKEYLTQNPDAEIYSSDESGKFRVPYRLIDGIVRPSGPPMRTRGFLGFFSSFMEAPGRDEFAKIIK